MQWLHGRDNIGWLERAIKVRTRAERCTAQSEEPMHSTHTLVTPQRYCATARALMSFQAVDYRKVDELSTTSVELSSAALGGKVLGCSDEWFADASNLVKPHAAESLKGQFGPKGALYEG